MDQLDRRTFLTRSSLLAAAAGAAAMVPTALITLTADAPEVDAAAADTATAEEGASLGAADASATLVAHVRDLSTGEIGLFNGMREVVIQDPALARTLYQASR